MKTKLLLLASIAFSLNTFAQTGGPDAFGYVYANSTTASVDFTWEEIDPALGGSGTSSSVSGLDDDHEANIALGFSFPFYGNTYTTVSIGTNGGVYFEDTYLGLTNNCIPGAPSYQFAGDSAFIAAVWDDLDPSSGGNVYYQSFGNKFVIEFSDVVEYGGSDGDTWQVILYDNGVIDINYKETSFVVASTGGSTGIQGSPSLGLSYNCAGSGDSFSDSLTIRFQEPVSAGLKENDNLVFSVYPNPSNGQFFVKGEKINSISVVDLAGREVYFSNISDNNSLVNLDNVSSGIYTVLVNQNNTVKTTKIIVE